MTNISLLSILTVVVSQFLGVFYHWWRMKKKKRVKGSFIDYLFAESPSSTTAVFFVIITGAWFSATTGTADLINPQMIFDAFNDDSLTAADIHAVNALVGAITTGYAADSILKGETK